MTILYNKAGILFAGVDGIAWHICGDSTRQKLETYDLLEYEEFLPRNLGVFIKSALE